MEVYVIPFSHGQLKVTTGIEYISRNNRYHLFVVPFPLDYTRYNSRLFGEYELHDGIYRKVVWLTLDQIYTIGVHPRCTESSYFYTIFCVKIK